MGFEGPQNSTPPMEEGNEEREKLAKELEDVNKSIEYCEKAVGEASEKKYDEYTKLIKTPDEQGVMRSYNYIENSRLQKVYLDLKEEWLQKLEEYKVMRLDLNKKLGSEQK